MGTRGYFVYRHKGRYHVYYHPSDSYPEGLGLELLAEIPVDPDRFQKWLNQERSNHDQAHSKKSEFHDIIITTTRPNNDLFIEWIYEMDLDSLVFSVNCCPMYYLDHMPPRAIFLEGISIDNYRQPACRFSIPSEYRFECTPPPVEDSALEVYQLHHSSRAPPTIHETLSRHESLSQRETVCVRVLEVTIGITMEDANRSTIYEMQVLPNLESMTSDHRRLMARICRVAICPAYYRTDMWSDFERSVPKETFWWFRKHICIRPSVHLEDDRNLQLSISELFTEAMSKGGAGIVYGVAFSLFHCCIMRIDRAGSGSFKHTAVLPFLPSPWAESPSTEGITALARLGDVPGIDEDVYFLILRDLYRYDHAGDSNESLSSSAVAITTPKPPQLPLELLGEVANYIDSADTMNIFACASRWTMAAALYWLKYPQIDRVYTGDDRLPVSVILDSAQEPKVIKDDYSHLVNGVFGACIEGKEVMIRLTRLTGSRNVPDKSCKSFFCRYVEGKDKGNTAKAVRA